MNVTDLPALMRERSEQDAVPTLSESRMDGITRKVASARRRRIASAVASLAVVVAAIVIPYSHVIGSASGHRTVRPAASPTVNLIDGFPEYAIGGRLIGTIDGSLNGGPKTLTVTPTDLGFIFSARCSMTGPATEIDINISIGTAYLSSFDGCDGTNGGGYYGVSPIPSDEVQPGVATTVTVTIVAYQLTLDSQGQQTGRQRIAPPDGRYSFGIWQKLPFTAYPLPPRPKTLPTLDPKGDVAGQGPGSLVVHSDPADPLAPRTLTFRMADCPTADTVDNCNPTMAMSATPGLLNIAVNGVTVNTAEFWDYSGGGSGFDITPDVGGLHLRAGDQVTVTITPQYVTGAWLFAVRPEASQ